MSYTQQETYNLMKEALEMAKKELGKEISELRLQLLAKEIGVKEIKWIKK